MILATIQPSFLPWLGYLEQMDVADVFVYLDDVKYTRQDWRNRNRFMNAAGQAEYITVPVRADSDKQLIKDVLIADDPSWARKTMNKLNAWYARAPYSEHYLPRVGAVLTRKHERLVDLNNSLMELLIEAYGITTPIRSSSEAGITVIDKNQRLIDLCLYHGATMLYDGAAAANFIDKDRFREAGIEVIFQNYHPQPYPQSKHPFVSHLSALDVLLWCGESARTVMRASPFPEILERGRVRA